MALPKPYRPTNPGWGAAATYAKRTNPPPAWQGLQTQMKNVFGGDPYAGEQAAIKYGWSQGSQNNQYASPYAGGAGGGGAGGRWVQPDYTGILGSFTADARARFGAGLEAMKAQRLSGAKAAINRLGIRDVPGMLEKMQAYGLSQADLQGAKDNPWSELKALDQFKQNSWANAVSRLAGQGGFRSGATMNSRETIDNEAARNEAMLTQDTLAQLSEGLFGEKEWERQGRDQLEQSIVQRQAELAGAYQPYWQPD